MNAISARATGIPAGSLDPTVSDRTSRATRILQAANQILPSSNGVNRSGQAIFVQS
ncbi:hypothetical protein [Mesorhizobium silamurunense]|uniref:hypothetical protein n=1 Tax=Mesorhizobium silamurunense TaxID=499528 RepID=UPI00177C1394